MSEDAPKCFAILTAIGQAMVAESIRIGAKINITHLAVGDAEYVPTEGQTRLVGERIRLPVSEITYDQENPAWLRVTTVIPPQLGGWRIYEAGLFCDNGNMFAVAKLDGSYKPVYSDGAVKEIAIDIIIEVASEANVNLTVDPYVIIATRKWVTEYFAGRATWPFGVRLLANAEMVIERGEDGDVMDPANYQSIELMPRSTAFAVNGSRELTVHLMG